MAKTDDFHHLHTHSDYSQLDGCATVKDYVEAAEGRGHKALALTEHGTMRGIHALTKATEGSSIKPIYGVEFYVSPDMHQKGLTEAQRAEAIEGIDKKVDQKHAIRQKEYDLGLRDRWHLTAWAKTDEGLRNLYKLTSMAWLEGYYYKPRIDIATLLEHGDGLMVGTGCLSSPINSRAVAGRLKRATREADALFERFGEDLWLEVMPHDIGDQVTANDFILGLRKRYGLPNLLATQDAHYIRPKDHHHHDVLLCIGTGAKLADEKRLKFDGTEFYFKRREDMEHSFEWNHRLGEAYVKEALDNTIVLAERVEARIVLDRFKCLLPPVDLPERFGDEFSYLKEMVKLGWEWREIPERAERMAKREGISYDQALQRYRDRLKHELKVLRERRIVPYFLIVRDLYDFARRAGVAHGPGRGSSAGSLIAFLLGITTPDPLEHGLMFERFLSPGRIDMPDIDMDFEDVRRKEILDYLREKYGLEQVAQITTVGQLSGKQCLKDVARVLEVPYLDSNAATNEIDNEAGIETSFERSKLLQEFDAKFPQVRYYARKLEGMNKSLGIHAAGVVTCPVPLHEVIPLELRDVSKDPTVVTALDMHGVQDFGLLKFDVLGLRMLTVLRMARDEVNKVLARRYPDDAPKLDLEKIDIEAKEVIQGFTDHDYVGVFQFDSVSAGKVTEGVEYTGFADIAAFNALNRPGTTRSGLAEEYVKRRRKPARVERTPYHAWTKDITSDTLGVIIYQEQVVRIFTDIAGFSPGEADELRRKIGKSAGDEALAKEKDHFIKGALTLNPGMPHEVAAKLMDDITHFGSYGFNKSHAVAYGMIAAWCMWMKKHYPLEFYWALLTCEPDQAKIQYIAADARNHGVHVLPPMVNASGASFTIDRGEPGERSVIRGSLSDIKNVGLNVVNQLTELRPFDSLADFLERVPRRVCNRRVIESLAKAGAMADMIPNLRWLLENLDTIWSKRDRVGFDGWLAEQLEASKGTPDYDEEERVLLATSVNPTSVDGHPFDVYESFIKRHIRVELARTSERGFWDSHRYCYVAGTITGVQLYQVGDFHKAKELPTKAKRESMRWGRDYANIDIESSYGRSRLRIDWDIFEDYRHIVEAPKGTPIIAFASLNKKYYSLRARFIVDLEELRCRVRDSKPLGPWEGVLTGHHPISTGEWTSKAARRRAMVDIWAESRMVETRFKATGVVTHVRTKPDRNGNEMAWFGLLGYSGFLEVVCFGSAWPDYADAIKPGAFISVELDRVLDDAWGDGVRLDGGKVWRKKYRTVILPTP